MSTYSATLLLLGASGYVGAEVLIQLKEQYPNINVIALLRNPTEQRKASLTQLNPNVIVVEGSLDDAAIIREQALKADIVINSALGEGPFVQPLLDALEESSKQRPANPPIYIHTSGYGTFSDNSRGETVEKDKIPKYVDTTFNLDNVPQTNSNIAANRAVVAAGERKENPVKTLILFPGWIYGIGSGPQPITISFRLFFSFAKAAGHVVTFGPGHNILPPIHVKDVAKSYVALVRGALEGTAPTGAHGFYFAGQEFDGAPTLKDILDVAGNTLHELGLVPQPRSQQIPQQIGQGVPEILYSIFAGNSYGVPEQLKKLGVEFTETKKTPILASLLEEVKLSAKDWA